MIFFIKRNPANHINLEASKTEVVPSLSLFEVQKSFGWLRFLRVVKTFLHKTFLGFRQGFEKGKV